MPEKHLAVLVEIPAVYVENFIEGGSLREYLDVFGSESEFILNCIGEPSVVRLRMEIGGEKDSEVVEVWGDIREASLVDAGRGYGKGPHLTDDQLADAGGHKLLRDENACEWCQYRAEPDEEGRAA